jgi:hypothetical protein
MTTSSLNEAEQHHADHELNKSTCKRGPIGCIDAASRASWILCLCKHLMQCVFCTLMRTARAKSMPTSLGNVVGGGDKMRARDGSSSEPVSPAAAGLSDSPLLLYLGPMAGTPE